MMRRSFCALMLAPLLSWPLWPVVAARIRVSSVTGDPGKEVWLQKAAQGFVPQVTLDGQEVTMVQTADETEGVIVRAATDKDGEIYLNSAGNEIVMETLRGDVKVNWIKDVPLAAYILELSRA